MKFAAVFASIVCFSIICALFYIVGFVGLGENDFMKEFIQFMLFQLMMNIEIASICFVISAVSKKNKLGIGISIAMLFYVYDLMARVIPDLKDIIFLSPFSYANASTIFSNCDLDAKAIILGAVVSIAAISSAVAIYAKRDLAS